MRGQIWQDKKLETLNSLLRCIQDENRRQLAKWDEQKYSIAAWSLILNEEVGELNKELCTMHFTEGAGEYQTRRDAFYEAIRVATLALKIAEMTGV